MTVIERDSPQRHRAHRGDLGQGPLTPALSRGERETVRPPSLDSCVLDVRSPCIPMNVESWTLNVTRHNVRHRPFALCSLRFATLLCALCVSAVHSGTVTVIEPNSPQRATDETRMKHGPKVRAEVARARSAAKPQPKLRNARTPLVPANALVAALRWRIRGMEQRGRSRPTHCPPAYRLLTHRPPTPHTSHLTTPLCPLPLVSVFSVSLWFNPER